MNNTKTTKKALVASVISILLCATMLVGTTYAWFTDTATTGVNTIVAGNLDIVLEYRDADGDWIEVDASTLLFDNDALWEPGYTEVAYIRVRNNGSLTLKYNLAVDAANEVAGTNVAGESFKLSDYIMFGQVVSETEISAYATREDAQTAVAGSAATLKTFDDADTLVAGAEKYIALVVYMPTTVGNEANHNGVNVPSIELGVNVVAFQATAESDSFNNQYDVDADVADLSTLQGEAARNLTGTLVLGKLNATLVDEAGKQNLNIGDANLKASGVNTLIFNGGVINTPYNGHVKNTNIEYHGDAGHDNGTAHVYNEVNGSKINLNVPENTRVVFKNLTINGYYNFNAYQITSGLSLEFVNCTFNGGWVGQTNGITNIKFTNCTFTLNGTDTTNVKNTNPVWLQRNGGTTTFEGCTINGNRPIKIDGANNTVLNVTNCTFNLESSQYDIDNNRPDRVTAIRFDANVNATVKNCTMTSGYAFYQVDPPIAQADNAYDHAADGNVKNDGALWRVEY